MTATEEADPTENAGGVSGRPRSTLWTPAHRFTTVGLVVVMTLMAFEYLGVATALPTLVANLHGGRLYAWPITAFAAASAVGSALAGRWADRRGPATPLLASIALFCLGLVIAGTASMMAMLLLGRVVQGFGAGACTVAMYVLIAQVYPQSDRPAMSAVLAGAWVVPSLVGPAVAGLVTVAFGWRWVFLGLLPLLLVGTAFVVPVVRRLPPPDQNAAPATRPGLVLAAIGAAIGVATLTAGAQQLNLVSIPIVLVGGVIAVVSLRRLVPRGTFRAARGLPAVVASRGLLAGAYDAVEAYLPLVLTAVHGLSPSLAGLPLTIGALGWSGASAWQSRYPRLSRSRLLRLAFVLIAIGLVGIALVAVRATPSWIALPAWVFAGAGMGIGMPAISVLLMAQSPPADRGFNSSAIQLAEVLASVVLVGLGGVLVNTFGSTSRPGGPLLVFDLLMAAVVVFGAILPARRTALDERSEPQS
ncbi:MAG TPA: MFS transporter [Pseudonocardiaceae bacterium]|jgi:MFS family permease|nr:MFS transporter [Pseudonocardiaceae bacterium]